MIPRATVAIVLAALCLVGVDQSRSCLARERSSADEDAAWIGWIGTRWYGVYWAGVKVGFVRESRNVEESGTIVVQRQSTYMIQVKSSTTNERYEFEGGAPFRLLTAVHETVQGSVREVVKVVRGTSGLVADVGNGVGRQRQMKVIGEYSLRDEFAEEEWTADGVLADTLSYRAWDSDLPGSKQVKRIVRVLPDSLVGGQRLRAFEFRTISGGEVDVSVIVVDEAGNEMPLAECGDVEARPEPEEVAKSIGPPQDPRSLGAVRADKALGDPSKVDRLVMVASGPGSRSVLSGSRQTVSGEEESTSGGGQVILGIGRGFGVEDVADSVEISDALVETVLYPIYDSAIQSCAARVAGEDMVIRDRVGRLVRFVHDWVDDDPTYGSLPVLDVLSGRKGDCSEHSALFVTLARAAGIPAREVSGLAYAGDKDPKFGLHGWAEVVIDGKWVPVDPTWNQVEVDATHVVFDLDSLSLPGTCLQFQVVEVSHGR